MTAKRYRGSAGQFAVMAELLNRGWNVAVPQVDVGDDVVVLNEQSKALIRVQVKTTRPKLHKTEKISGSKKTRNIYKGQFNIGWSQLAANNAPLVYVLTARLRNAFYFIVINRSQLAHLARRNRRKNPNAHSYTLPVFYSRDEDGGRCVFRRLQKRTDVLNDYLENWEDFPILRWT